MAETEERSSKKRKIDNETSEMENEGQIFVIDKKGGVLEADREPEIKDTRENDESSPFTAFPTETPNPNSRPFEIIPMSKNQLKKQLKREKWDKEAEYRKQKRKEKQKAKVAARAERALVDGFETTTKKLSIESVKQSLYRPSLTPITFVLDCSFDNLMNDNEITSLGSQLARCYSENRKARYKAHLVISSFGGKLRTRFETRLSNHHLGWKGARFMEEDFVKAGEVLDGVMRGEHGGRLAGAMAELGENGDVIAIGEANNSSSSDSPNNIPPAHYSEANPILPPEANRETTDLASPNIVYLSSDSPNTLTHLSPYTTYIIGGLVDKNRHKGLCYKQACARGIPTAKLPIGEYMLMQSRTVLTTNHVVEIMVRWLEGGDWGKAFMSVIPKRKGGVLRGGNPDENDARGKEDEMEEPEQVEEDEEDEEKQEGKHNERYEKKSYLASDIEKIEESPVL